MAEATRVDEPSTTVDGHVRVATSVADGYKEVSKVSAPAQRDPMSAPLESELGDAVVVAADWPMANVPNAVTASSVVTLFIVN